MEQTRDVSLVNHLTMELWYPAAKSPITARRALQDNKSYVRDNVPVLGAKVKGELQRILRSRKEDSKNILIGHQDNSDIFTDQLENMSLQDLSSYVRAETATLRSAKDRLNTQRSKGIHKASTKTADFILNFDRFLETYAGVVNIATQVDAQYGGVASATLSLLFATVKMKANDEEMITSAMQDMSDRLPDLQIYQKIYPDPALGSMLWDAYKDVILLSQEAISYFQRSFIGRTMVSMGKPTLFESMALKMRDDFKRIRVKCEVLLAQQVDRLEKEIKSMQEREDVLIVESTRTPLKLGNYQLEDDMTSLKAYRQYLKTKFDNSRHRESLGMKEFLDTRAGKCWQSDDSVVIVLSGCNEPGIATIADSWLTPVAVDIIQELTDKQCMVAFDMCDEKSTLESFLARIIFELLSKNPAVVRKGDDWHKILSSLSVDEVDKEEGLQASLLTIVDLQTEPIFIILNRPEASERDSPSLFIDAMLRLAQKTMSKVKILVIIRAEIWNIEHNMHSQYRKAKGKTDEALFTMMRFDQHRLHSGLKF